MAKKPFRVYYATFTGMYLGGHAVITARDKGHARRLLKARLETGKDEISYDKDYTYFEEITNEIPGIDFLDNGDY